MSFEEIISIPPHGVDTPVLPELEFLLDKDFAARLSYELEDTAFTIEHHVSTTINGKTHDVVVYRVEGVRYDGSIYTYVVINCSHNLLFSEARNSKYSDEPCLIRSNVQRMRREQVYHEWERSFNNPQGLGFYPSTEDYMTAVVDILKREENGEWLGFDGNSLYVQHFEDYFGVSFHRASEIVESLSTRGVVTRNGNIVSLNTPPTPRRLPTKLYATAKTQFGYSLEIYVPASWEEEQGYRVVCNGHSSMKSDMVHGFAKPLSPQGELNPEDVGWIQRAANICVEHTLASMNGNVPLELTNDAGFIPDPNPTPLAEGEHGALSISDFGWWSCSWCDQRGDEYVSPSSVPCIGN